MYLQTFDGNIIFITQPKTDHIQHHFFFVKYERRNKLLELSSSLSIAPKTDDFTGTESVDDVVQDEDELAGRQDGSSRT
jgi:hypothetical protein